MRHALPFVLLAACDAGDSGGDERPQVEITSPGDGGSIVEGVGITFLATVSDDNEASSDLTIVWTLDGVETLSGESTWEGDALFFVPAESPKVGDHELLLTAIDSAGNVGSDDTSFTVTENDRPNVTFVSPEDGDRFILDEPITVEVGVTDANETNLSKLSLAWSGSGAEGQDLATNTDSNGRLVAVVRPDAGNHDLVVTVTDSYGATATELVSFVVVDGDADGDGFLAVIDGGEDCDDDDATVYPGATETCNGTDDDCDGDADEDFDSDSDGLADCYDTEKCDGKDNDGDGQVDEDDATDIKTWYQDADGDGYGVPDATDLACSRPSGYAATDDDCDDTDDAVYPGADEDDCTDPTDYNCDGSVGFVDDDGDSYAACEDCDDNDADVFPGQSETCNDKDDDCDGTVDGSGATDAVDSYYDADGDGYGGTTSTRDCDVPSGYVTTGGDCDDSRQSVNPGATETCNRRDDDCDGDTDDDDPSVTGQKTWYEDGDDDGYGLDAYTTTACYEPTGYASRGGDCDDGDADYNPGASEADCTDPNDYNCDGSSGYDDNDADGYAACEECDDGDAAVNPAAEEVCDDVDNDCSGDIDGADATDATAWYDDDDEDGYGNPSTEALDCEAPEGTVADDSDCDDTDADINPDGTEVCDSADLDEDCDGLSGDDDPSVTGQVTTYTDADGDGFGAGSAVTSCNPPVGNVLNDDDCDDTLARANPAGTEVCDSADVDEDCDGLSDDDDPSVTGQTTSYTDADGDGYGSTTGAVTACEVPSGNAANDDDCDDTDADVNPGEVEVCDAADADEDCDGLADDDDPSVVGQSRTYADDDGDGYGDATDATISCDTSGGVSNDDDCDDSDAAINPAATEACDGEDNDCDGSTDESGATGESTWYRDADSDGYGTSATTRSACSAPSGYVSNDDDCNDSSAAISPADTEICDGSNTDEDCDGLADDDDPSATGQSYWYTDGDGDGYGDGASLTYLCDGPSGAVSNDDDCDDSDDQVSPAGVEDCNGVDDDCNGTVDDDATDALTWYADADSDSYGSTASATVSCSAPSGYISTGGDCDDADAAINPAATEACDGDDNDCDGSTDESGATGSTTYYRDADSDGYGNASSTQAACSLPSGYVSNDDDCDDGDSGINPAATEVCDGADDDEDCDGLADDDDSSVTGTSTWYLDADGDGYGVSTSTLAACDEPSGYADTSTDCDDGDGGVNPGERDVCEDGTDQDCDGTDAACVFAGDYDDTDGNTVIYADTTDDKLGWSVAAGFDMDGDGYDDVAASALGDDVSYSDRGSVFFFPGALTSGDVAAETEMSARRTPASSTSLVGYYVWPLEDYDDDGTDELVVLYYGVSASTRYMAILEGPLLPGTQTVASDADDSYSYSSSSINVRGVASGGVFDTARTTNAVIYSNVTFSSSKGSVGVDFNGTTTCTFSGESNSDYFGYALAGGNGADTDGDGYDDIWVGAPGDDDGGSGAGAVYLINGPQTALSSVISSVATSKITSATADDQLGTNVLYAGDVGGDGYADVFAAAPAYDGSAGSATGAVMLFEDSTDTSSTDATVLVTGAAAGDTLGVYLLDSGDIDGDGELDLVVGSPNASPGGTLSGAVYLLYGPLAGTYDMASGDYDAVFYGNDGDGCGRDGGLGDTDGDGQDDLAFGCANGEVSGVTDVGIVSVFSGM